MAEYKIGELLDITIRGRVLDGISNDEAVVGVAYGSEDDRCVAYIRTEVEGVVIARVAPAEWPPRAGDLWKVDGRRWFIAYGLGDLTAVTSDDDRVRAVELISLGSPELISRDDG